MNQRIELASLKGWPAIEDVSYDNWRLRCANDITKRSNSVQPLAVGQIDLVSKIKYCEEWYENRNQKAIFKLYEREVNDQSEPLENLLRERHYSKLDESLVMQLEISDNQFQVNKNVQIENGVTDQWVDAYLKVIQPANDKDYQTYQTLFRSMDCSFYTARYIIDGEAVGFGYGHVMDDLIGIFDIFVHKEFREEGIGRAIITSLLAYRQSHVKYSYLQVVAENYKAIKLYMSLGYETLYRYWYRCQ